MVRNYKRKTDRKGVDVSVMQDAISAIKCGNSIRKTAEQFQIPFETLRHATKKTNEDQRSTTVYPKTCVTRQIFTDTEELTLVDYLLMTLRIGFPVDTRTLRSMAYQLALRNEKCFPPSWTDQGLASKDWVTGFLKRHRSVSIRTPDATSVARATTFNKYNVKTFYSKLQDVYERNNLTPDRIFNLDETGLTTSQNPQKVIAESGTKQVAQLVSHERGQTVTMCGFVNAIGNALPPCLIFLKKTFKDYMIHGAPPGTLGTAHPIGWMTATVFLECLKHFVRYAHCSKDKTALLLLDNHESHVSLEAIDFCRENGIIMLIFPSHCTHKLQPLDKTVFGPFKTFYHKAGNDWIYNNPGKRMSIYDVASLVGKAYPKSFTSSNIISGFQCTGISPLDSNLFSDSDVYQSYINDRPASWSEEKDGSEKASTSRCSSHTEANSTAKQHECKQTVLDDQHPNSSSHTENLTHGSDIQQDASDISVTKDQNMPAPQKRNEHIFSLCSPEMVRPYLKAGPRKDITARKRKLGKCRILTDTPEKNKLMEERTKRSNVSKGKGKLLKNTPCNNTHHVQSKVS